MNNNLTGNAQKTENSCGTGCGCTTSYDPNENKNSNLNRKLVINAANNPTNKPRSIDIDFLYLDLDVCDPCKGTGDNLNQALVEAELALKYAGAEVSVRKTHVESFEQAESLNFYSSPTIRINGGDIQFDIYENHCQSCSDISGTETNCRIWQYRGQQYSEPPKEMIVEALLREVFAERKDKRDLQPVAAAPESARENLRRFFESKNNNKGVNAKGH